MATLNYRLTIRVRISETNSYCDRALCWNTSITRINKSITYRSGLSNHSLQDQTSALEVFL